MSITVTPRSPALGAEITGVDLARLLDAADLIAALPGGQTASHLRHVPRERVA